VLKRVCSFSHFCENCLQYKTKITKMFATIVAKFQQDLHMLTFDSFDTKRHNLPAKCKICKRDHFVIIFY
jgi:hypothetical protein